MVRCGQCQKTFDARPAFVADRPSQQLELPILDSPESISVSSLPVLQPMTLAEQVAVVEDEAEGEYPPQQRSWPWAVAASLLALLFIAQTAYFFRVDLAARLPRLKPALVSYCELLKCAVPLPKKSDLIGIESSELEADPMRENQINLNALLRNRAPFAQAFPDLELTLNDSQDKPLARRTFRPADYLPPKESEAAGIPANHELNIRLHLVVNDLRPIGYRLAVFYPGN